MNFSAAEEEAASPGHSHSHWGRTWIILLSLALLSALLAIGVLMSMYRAQRRVVAHLTVAFRPAVEAVVDVQQEE